MNVFLTTGGQCDSLVSTLKQDKRHAPNWSTRASLLTVIVERHLSQPCTQNHSGSQGETKNMSPYAC